MEKNDFVVSLVSGDYFKKKKKEENTYIRRDKNTPNSTNIINTKRIYTRILIRSYIYYIYNIYINMKSKRITEKSYRIVRNRREKRETKKRVSVL